MMSCGVCVVCVECVYFVLMVGFVLVVLFDFRRFELVYVEFVGKYFVFGLMGGIVCYKIVEFMWLFVKVGVIVQVVMIDVVIQFIMFVMMQVLLGWFVYMSQWDVCIDNNMVYIDLLCEVDVIVIVFVLMDFFVKFVYGFVDDLLLMLCVVCDCLLLVVFVMNCQMWQNLVM